MRKLKYLIAAVILVPIIVFLVVVYNAASVALQAEHTLHATLLMHEIVNDYLIREGDWPRSWEDLEKIPAEERCGFEWPKDSKRLQKHVEIDFDIDLDCLEMKFPEPYQEYSQEHFNPIRPIGSHYYYHDYPPVHKLYESIRQCKNLREAGFMPEQQPGT